MRRNSEGLNETYRLTGTGPKNQRLRPDGTDVQEYHSWRYAVDHRVEEDAPYCDKTNGRSHWVTAG
jgi:hypothetical protein